MYIVDEAFRAYFLIHRLPRLKFHNAHMQKNSLYELVVDPHFYWPDVCYAIMTVEPEKILLYEAVMVVDPTLRLPTRTTLSPKGRYVLAWERTPTRATIIRAFEWVLSVTEEGYTAFSAN
jgi:hypothetical protein